MSRRTERVASVVRETIGELILRKVADPRVDPVRTSVTSVDVPEDLLTAKVYVSVMGTESEQRRAVEALQQARGYFQDRLGRQMHLRNTPVLEFVLDVNFKKALDTLDLIREAMDEIHQREAGAGEAPEDADAGDEDGSG